MCSTAWQPLKKSHRPWISFSVVAESVLRGGLPYIVASLDGRVVGYSYATTYRPRATYRHTIEDSVYIADGHRGLGVGRLLLSELIARSEKGGMAADDGRHWR